MSNIQLLGMQSCGQIMVRSAQCAHRMRKLSILLVRNGVFSPHQMKASLTLGRLAQFSDDTCI